MKVKITKAISGGEIRAIGSKSQAHRLIIAGYLSKTHHGVTCWTTSRDIEATSECMMKIFGVLQSDIRERIELNVGESGSTLRFLMPITAALGLDCDFIMEGRLPERPMEPLIEQMRIHRVEVTRPEREVYRINGKLEGGIYELPGNMSSQYVTGLLMALPLAEENSEIRILGELQSRPYVDMTLDVLKMSDIEIIEDESGYFYVPGGQEYRLEGQHDAEGDWSNSAFWLAAGAISGADCGTELSDSSQVPDLTVNGLDLRSIQGDKAIYDILKSMGAEIYFAESDVEDKALSGVKVSGRRLSGMVIDCRDIPDLVPAIAAAALGASGKTIITNAERLRLKESDRIESVLHVIRALGGLAEERPDGLEIYGGHKLHGGEISSYNDHRIAMMAACLRSLTPKGPEGDIIIDGAEAVNKSYPDFFDVYRSLGGKFEIM